MNNALGAASKGATASALAGFVGFMRWASQYGHDIRPNQRPVVGAGESAPVKLELSAVLSASFNFGYDPENQAVYIALDAEEYEWLSLMPVAEVVVGVGEVYVITHAIELDGEQLDAMLITVQTGQPKLWRAFPDATTVGFMCVRYKDTGMEVSEFSNDRYPLRYLND